VGNSGRVAEEVCIGRLIRIHRNTMCGAAESELRRDSNAATRYRIMCKRSPKEESAIHYYSGRLLRAECWARQLGEELDTIGLATYCKTWERERNKNLLSQSYSDALISKGRDTQPK